MIAHLFPPFLSRFSFRLMTCIPSPIAGFIFVTNRWLCCQHSKGVGITITDLRTSTETYGRSQSDAVQEAIHHAQGHSKRTAEEKVFVEFI
jgi:hypothetical protein